MRPSSAGAEVGVSTAVSGTKPYGRLADEGRLNRRMNPAGGVHNVYDAIYLSIYLSYCGISGAKIARSHLMLQSRMLKGGAV